MIKKIMMASRIFLLKFLSNIATACTPAEVEAPFTASTAPAEWPKSPTRLARAGQLLRSLKQCDNVLACGEGRPFERRCFRACNHILKHTTCTRMVAAKPAARDGRETSRGEVMRELDVIVYTQRYGAVCRIAFILVSERWPMPHRYLADAMHDVRAQLLLDHAHCNIQDPEVTLRFRFETVSMLLSKVQGVNGIVMPTCGPLPEV